MRSKVLQWLRDWEVLINGQDFAKARTLFAEDVVSFGTFSEILTGLADLEARQWRVIWPTIAGFTFDDPKIVISGDTAIVISLWHSQGKTKDGGWYDRRGRCTLVLRQDGEKLLCIHSHLSMEPGIPPLSD
ncbi:YybH family protein [Aestuariivirga sp. YIM B02566]|uniref:Nuclear transport factor 2 family protein n=1 Tax=Taklimakanibacter albus TaxID=2800327 RepID=A0ACC5R0A4_9HYPH|nr:nuclear transport factor 2 family protein [Aestuariivirga sp. YIM B02566]MBK1866043.1 nuclear transport factor 2 family protein [Aestuariivirga sp. YIM B02566]